MKKTVLLIIKSYQKYISNSFLGKAIFGNNCRFYPTCSQFTYEAVVKYGTIRGLYLGVVRLLKCHPFSKGGIDPVK